MRAVEEVPIAFTATEVAHVTARMARGDETAFHQFFSAYFDRLFRYLLVVSGGHEELAREALQSTLVRVARYVRRFPSEPAWWSWLTVLARTALIDEERKQRRYRKLVCSFGESLGIESAQPAPEDLELDRLLQSALADLDDNDRRLIEAKYLEGQTVRELAQSTGASEKAIESRLTRLRQRLRADLISSLQHPEHPTREKP